MITSGAVRLSTAACTSANSASRVPLTGSTMVAGSTLPARSAKRRSSQRAAAAAQFQRARGGRIGAQAVDALAQRLAARTVGGSCCGSPMDRAMGGSCGGGAPPAISFASFSKG